MKGKVLIDDDNGADDDDDDDDDVDPKILRQHPQAPTDPEVSKRLENASKTQDEKHDILRRDSSYYNNN